LSNQRAFEFIVGRHSFILMDLNAQFFSVILIFVSILISTLNISVFFWGRRGGSRDYAGKLVEE